MSLRDPRAVIALGAAAAILVLAPAGCGGNDRNEAAAEGASSMTEAQLAKRLGEICQEHTDRQVVAIEEFDKKHGLPYGPRHEEASDAQLEKELIVVILPIVRDNIHDLERKLRPSRRQDATLESFYKALEHGIEVSEEDPGWVTGSTAREPFMRARNLSSALGTPLCGQA